MSKINIIKNSDILGQKLNVVYVLTSTERDPYLEQLYLSIYSMRLNGNKHTRASVVTDSVSYCLMDDYRRKLLDAADTIYIVDLSKELSAKVRSRILKTTLREIIKGDYLYIDTDTIVAGDLEDNAELKQIQLGFVDDVNIGWDDNPLKETMAKNQNSVFELSQIDHYYNGGVTWAKDTKTVHDFYGLWNKLYLEGEAKGCSFDQPSLQYVNAKNPIIDTISGCWNVMGAYGARYYHTCKVFHYVRSFTTEPYHFFMSADNLKDAAAILLSEQESERARYIKSVLSDFSLGYDEKIWLQNRVLPQYETHPLYWFIVNNQHKKWFKIVDKFGVLLNKLFH